MGCGSSGFNQISNTIRPGARRVFCVKLQRELEGLDEIPFEGQPLGQKIYDNVSKDAWKMRGSPSDTKQDVSYFQRLKRR